MTGIGLCSDQAVGVKMRVLIVTLAAFGPKRKGGGERYATELTRALRGLGAEVEVVAVPTMRRLFLVPDLDGSEVRIGLKHFLKLTRWADVVHVHQLNAPGFDYAAVACRLLRKPLVLTDHGGGALAAGRALGRTRLRTVAAAGFVSAWSQRDIDPRGLIEKTAVILGGGDHLPVAQPLDRSYDIGFVGRLLPHKGAHVAIEALPAGASLILAGQVRDKAYKERLDQLAIGRDVTFIEDASDQYVASLYKSVACVVMPSVESYEGSHYRRPELLGLVAIEALAAGRPVIGSNVGGLGELLAIARQPAVRPGDVAALREAFERVATCAPSVEPNDFTWRAVAERCIRLYHAARSRSR